MKTFNDFSEVNQTINSIAGLSDAEKTNLCNLIFDKYKEQLELKNENSMLRAKLLKARQDVWR